jgi:mono/diheme cytochrome c family protein
VNHGPAGPSIGIPSAKLNNWRRRGSRHVVLAVFFLLLAFASSRGEEKRPLTDADATAGRTLYLQECGACHGERGDGAGPAAQFLEPRPRDFTKRTFKIRSTDSGMPPRTDDLLRTIERGLPGSAMPAYAFLSEPERRSIAAQVLSLAGLLHEPEPPRVPAPTSPPPPTRESVAHGKQLYRDAQCDSCHGKEGKGDGPSARTLRDTDDRPIPARDLTTGVFRGGGDRLELFYRISVGMDGSPMPAFASAIDEPDRWALVDYVLSFKPGSAKRMAGDRAALEIAGRTGCRACHVLGDGRGGTIGADLRSAARKLRPEWVAEFLRHPRASGKIYPASAYRMPDVFLTPDEQRILAAYIAKLGARSRAARTADLAAADPATISRGQTIFASRCSACHSLGESKAGAGSPAGPDLTPAADRLDFDWAKSWLGEHGTTTGGASRFGQADVETVRMFVWKTSGDALAKSRLAPAKPGASN